MFQQLRIVWGKRYSVIRVLLDWTKDFLREKGGYIRPG